MPCFPQAWTTSWTASEDRWQYDRHFAGSFISFFSSAMWVRQSFWASFGPQKMVIRRASHVLFTKLRNNSVETCWITPNSRHWWPEGSKPKDGQCWPIKYTSLWVWFFHRHQFQWLRNEATESHSAEVVGFFFDLIKWSAKLTNSKTCLIKIVWAHGDSLLWFVQALDTEEHLTWRNSMSHSNVELPQGNEPCGSR